MCATLELHVFSFCSFIHKCILCRCHVALHGDQSLCSDQSSIMDPWEKNTAHNQFELIRMRCYSSKHHLSISIITNTIKKKFIMKPSIIENQMKWISLSGVESSCLFHFIFAHLPFLISASQAQRVWTPTAACMMRQIRQILFRGAGHDIKLPVSLVCVFLFSVWVWASRQHFLMISLFVSPRKHTHMHAVSVSMWYTASSDWLLRLWEPAPRPPRGSQGGQDPKGQLRCLQTDMNHWLGGSAQRGSSWPDEHKSKTVPVPTFKPLSTIWFWAYPNGANPNRLDRTVG